jgi:uncharacterized repeat protein (TIGR03803 family)
MMKTLRLSAKALSLYAIMAMLAGCGGAQKATPFAPVSPEILAHPLGTHGYRIIYTFQGGKDGCGPLAGLFRFNGLLYGTTGGGILPCSQKNPNYGTVFSISTSGSEQVLHTFGGPPDGASPDGSLIELNNVLYGTTEFGGPYCSAEGSAGCGTIFSVTKSGKELVQYSFSDAIGFAPRSGLTLAPYQFWKTAFYGTTVFGGKTESNNGYGTVFVWVGYGQPFIVHFFGETYGDGIYPQSSLLNVNGNLYGTTEGGGAHGAGTVFEISAGSTRVLYSFKGGSDGAYPVADLINVNGTLYGTTEGGGGIGSYCLGKSYCGTVFSITTSGTESIVYRFKGGPNDGDEPQAGVLSVNGRLYGTTAYGGRYEDGTVFEIASQSERVLHSFKYAKDFRDGSTPVADLIKVGHKLYGTTEFGGPNDNGTVFEVSP